MPLYVKFISPAWYESLDLPAIVLGLIISCASTSTASIEKDEKAKSFETISNKGVVYLYRPGRALGAAGQTQVKINGLDAGGTGPGTFFRWELTPAEYVFSCKTPESSAAVELNVESGKLYFLMQNEHLGVSSGRVSLKEVNEKEGMKAVNNSKLLISTYTN